MTAPPRHAESSLLDEPQVEGMGRAIDEAIRLVGWPTRCPSGGVGRALWHLLAAEEATRLGDMGAADVALQSAREESASISPDSVAGIELNARTALVTARRSLKGGRTRGLVRVLVQARARLRDLGSPRPLIRMALLEQEALVRLMMGRYDAARRAIDLGLAESTEAQRHWQARFYRLRGAIHARLGYPLLAAHAYRHAVDCLLAEGEEATPTAALDAGRLLSNLAMAHLMAGQADDARGAIDEALSLRKGHGASLAELANSMAVRALVLERTPGDGACAWREAVELAEGGGDTNLRVEIALRAANWHLMNGQPERAEALYVETGMAAEGAPPVEPTVGAFAAELRARLAHARGDAATAREEARRTLGAYRRLGAEFHEARVELFMARLESDCDNPRAADRRAARACTLALRGCFELAWRAEDRALLGGLALTGPKPIRRYCRLHGIGREPVATVLLFDESGTVEFIGECHELGAGSVPYRLLRAIVRAGRRGIAREALGRALWGADLPEDKAGNRIKVHVHRLRELLGRSQETITNQRPRRPGDASLYRWNPGLETRIVPRRKGRRG